MWGLAGGRGGGKILIDTIAKATTAIPKIRTVSII